MRIEHRISSDSESMGVLLEFVNIVKAVEMHRTRVTLVERYKESMMVLPMLHRDNKTF